MKSKKIERILLSCFVIIIVACLVLGIVLALGLGISIWRPVDLFGDLSNDTDEQPLDQANQITIEVPSEAETPTPEVQDEKPSLPDKLLRVLLEIEVQVTSLRGLTANKSVEKVLITEEDLQDIVVNDFFSDYTDEDARKDSIALSVLGLIPEGFDLHALYQALYTEQIAGFYDQETEEIYVVQGEDFGGNEKLTYAHEFTHVLQDQTYGFEEGLGLTDESCGVDSERCAAITSLIEGDATLTELKWFEEHGSLADYRDLMQAYEEFESPVLDSAPSSIAADLYFPYDQGYAFVQSLYDEGGFDAVDDAYLNLPVSTEQILHPERYPGDIPLSVELPDLSSIMGGNWYLFDQNIMGEWYTYLILNKGHNETFQLNEDQAKEAAEGWGGDAYAFYLEEGSDNVAFILDLVWDTTQDADEFTAAFLEYAELRWGSASGAISGFPRWEGAEGISVLMREGDRTLWVLAPTNLLVESILQELR
jgi:hypothetical protein